MVFMETVLLILAIIVTAGQNKSRELTSVHGPELN
jgi:hypothetical protein